MEAFVKVYLKKYEFEDLRGAREGKYQHLVGRELLNQGLKELLNLDFTEEMLLKETNGKPELKNREIFFNISHCKGLVACAFSNVPLGVDVERPRTVREGVIKKSCSVREREYLLDNDVTHTFLCLWTLKESYIKMTGEGLKKPLREIEFGLSPWRKSETGLWVREHRDIGCSHRGFFFQIWLGEEPAGQEEKTRMDAVLSLCTEKRTDSPVLIET